MSNDRMEDGRFGIKTEIAGKWLVSTVELLARMIPGYRTHETMVFALAGIAEGSWHELDFDEYYSEADARIGHEAMVAKWTAKSTTADAKEGHR